MRKIKVQAVTLEEAAKMVLNTTAKMEAATVGQLQASLTAIAEAYIEVAAECPDTRTKYGLAMALISQTLDANADAESLQEALPLENLKPLTDATN